MSGWVAGAIVVGGIGSALISANAAGDAADIQAGAGQAAIDEQRRASDQALGFFGKFDDVVQRGIDQSDFLANPEAQFEFLQNNPLFKLALENANRTTQASSASRGRLNSGDTAEQLSNNVLLSASPLIDRQRQDINNLLGIGTGLATNQANAALGVGSNVSNLLTDIGASQAAGEVGQANAQNQGIANIISGLISSGVISPGSGGNAPPINTTPPPGSTFMSDRRLKRDIIKVGRMADLNVYEFKYLWSDKVYIGFMSDEVRKVVPEAVHRMPHGFDEVDYNLVISRGI